MQNNSETGMTTAEESGSLTQFDYSRLSNQTISILQSAEDMIRNAKKDYIIKVADAVGMAHDELCGDTVVQNSDNGRFAEKENTFRSWCEAQGIGKTIAYNLLQVSDLICKSSPIERRVLEQASPSLLYAAAKPSAPTELVQAVKDGDITTHAEYQRLKKELDEERMQRLAAEKDAEEAEALAEQRREAKNAAQRQLDEAIKEREGARQALEAVKMRADRWQREAEASPASIPVQVVDQDEVERIAEERAQALTAELRAQLQELTAQQDPLAEDDVHAAHDAAILACRTIGNAWDAVRPFVLRLPEPNKQQVREMLLQKLMVIKEDICKCL